MWDRWLRCRGPRRSDRTARRLRRATQPRKREDVSRSSKEALERAGTSLDQVVRTRTLLTRIEDWEAVASVHGEFFGAIRPANTIMQVSRFIDPEWLVEFEVDAVVEQEAVARIS